MKLTRDPIEKHLSLPAAIASKKKFKRESETEWRDPGAVTSFSKEEILVDDWEIEHPRAINLLTCPVCESAMLGGHKNDCPWRVALSDARIEERQRALEQLLYRFEEKLNKIYEKLFP